jgi:hypothetical protein
MEAPEEPAAGSRATNGVNGHVNGEQQDSPTTNGTEKPVTDVVEEQTTNGAEESATNGTGPTSKGTEESTTGPVEDGTTIADDDNLVGTPWTLTCPVHKGIPNQVSRGVYTGIDAPKERPKLQIRYAITPGQSWAEMKRYSAMKR